MVRKTTPNSSAAKKAVARKHVVPKAGARASTSTAKPPARKGQPAKSPAKPVAKSAVSKQAKKVPAKKPAVGVKPLIVKTLDYLLVGIALTSQDCLAYTLTTMRPLRVVKK